ncbi:hypothetical protein [Spiroplasma endosymbiont of Aspidapion aeneum]|uniref:hypothetical protein n=1 Tax=Spiroplasma endosymbiont of Aspidapion aeneum TaxID=3066276 RepID=UPI00313DF53F
MKKLLKLLSIFSFTAPALTQVVSCSKPGDSFIFSKDDWPAEISNSWTNNALSSIVVEKDPTPDKLKTNDNDYIASATEAFKEDIENILASKFTNKSFFIDWYNKAKIEVKIIYEGESQLTPEKFISKILTKFGQNKNIIKAYVNISDNHDNVSLPFNFYFNYNKTINLQVEEFKNSWFSSSFYNSTSAYQSKVQNIGEDYSYYHQLFLSNFINDIIGMNSGGNNNHLDLSNYILSFYKNGEQVSLKSRIATIFNSYNIKFDKSGDPSITLTDPSTPENEITFKIKYI